jgi:hypothetical protein
MFTYFYSGHSKHSLQKRLQLDILQTHNINLVNIVMFIKHVYVQCAAEPNLHTYMKYRLEDLRFCPAVLLQFTVSNNETPSHWCNIVLLEPATATVRNQRLGVLAQEY